jgi:hypothetical protein
MTSLYELTGELKQLQAMADCGEMDAQTLADTMEAIDAEFNQKAQAVLCVRASMLAEVAGIESEIERLQKLKQQPAKQAENLTDYLKASMLKLEMDKVKTPLFNVTLRKASKKLGDIDESKLDDKYFKEVPATRKLDKRALLADAKLNPIDGAEVIYGERSLTIK